jgi:hypothetical protein
MSLESEVKASGVELGALSLEFEAQIQMFAAAAFRGDHKAIDDANENCINALQRKLDATVNNYRLIKKQMGL